MSYTVVDVQPDTDEWLQERRREMQSYPAGAICVVAGCGARPIARWMCNAHYKRLRARGTLDLPEPTPLVERLMRKVVKTDSCWLWQGAVNRGGYGVIGRGRRGAGNVLVHRAAYEHFIGVIPNGLHVDHLCCVRNCLNPSHLEAVTKAENDRRRDERRRANELPND